MKRPDRPEILTEKKSDRQRAPYEPPTLHRFTEEELLELVGPAQAYSGPPTGTSGGGSF